MYEHSLNYLVLDNVISKGSTEAIRYYLYNIGLHTLAEEDLAKLLQKWFDINYSTYNHFTLNDQTLFKRMTLHQLDYLL